MGLLAGGLRRSREFCNGLFTDNDARSSRRCCQRLNREREYW